MRHVWLDAWTEKRAMTDWMEEREGCVMVRVLVVPRASRTRILGVHDGRLKIQLAAPPVDGQVSVCRCEAGRAQRALAIANRRGSAAVHSLR